MPCSCMNLGKLCCDVSSETFPNFPNIDKLVTLNFHHLRLINFIESINKIHQIKNSRIFWTNNICLLLYSWLHSNEILNVSFSLLTSIGTNILALISRQTSFTYSIDNGFKLLLGRVNFITVLKHSLYVSLTLIVLTTNKVSIIQRASFGGVDSQALLTSDNYGNDILDLV